MNDGAKSLDRFVGSPVAQLGAFVWGLAEATIFFIVPDVLLSILGCRSIHSGWKAAGHALMGALLGGAIMYAIGNSAPGSARNFLIQVPAIHPNLIGRVQAQLNRHPTGAILSGPIMGIPYKIYAVESGTRHEGLLGFLLISIPARGLRFLLTVFLAGGITRLMAPWTKRSAPVELTALALFWVGFYTFYFKHFGW